MKFGRKAKGERPNLVGYALRTLHCLRFCFYLPYLCMQIRLTINNDSDNITNAFSPN